MRYFTVTATIDLTTAFDSTVDLVKSEAETLLRNTINRRINGYGEARDIESARITVEVEEGQEPEPTLTLTKSELDKLVADCVAEALAAANVATTPAE